MRSLKGLLPLLALIVVSLLCGVFGTLTKSSANDLVIERFPVEVGKSWDYRRTFHLVIYDTSSGGVEEHLVVDSLHAEFMSVDSLNGWECFRYNSQLFEAGGTYLDIIWYAHPDTAFLEIAYCAPTHAGPPWKDSGKLKFKFGGRYFDSLDELRLYLHQMRVSSFANTSSGTTFWKPPKKLFVFPLTVGTRWISMTDPWKEEREVVREEIVNVPAGGFLTLKMDIRPDMEGFLLYQWLAERGVVKDSAYLDTSEVTNEFGETIGYAVGYDKYELLGHGLTEVPQEVRDNTRPAYVSMGQNCPNPFNPATIIRFSLSVSHPANTTLKIYNVLGEEIRTLVSEPKEAGSYEVIWDGKDYRGNELASGVYFCRLKVGGSAQSKKMLLLK